MTLYLDASVILPMLVKEPASDVVDSFIRSLSQGLVVSEFAAAEVASALSRLVRTGALTPAYAASRLADFDAWRASATTDIDIHASDIRLASIFVRRFELMLRAPDAVHAAVCRRTNCLLVTLDRRLASAAENLGLEVKLLA